MATKRQVMLMKTLQRKACISDENWKAFLWSRFSVESCVQLEAGQVDEVLGHLDKFGVCEKLAGRMVRRRKEAILGRLRMVEENRKLLTLMANILAEAGLTLEYANAMAKRIFKVEAADKLTKKQLFYINKELLRYKKNGGNYGDGEKRRKVA